LTYQSNFYGYSAFLLQSALGSPAVGAGGTIIRQTGGTPAKFSKAAIPSKEIRQDGQPTRGRHGMQTAVGGPYGTELSIQSADQIMQAVLRGTWDTEITAVAADFTSLTYGAHTIVWNTGNPITKGFRVNDVIELTIAEDIPNKLTNLRVTALSATTITVAETLTIDATADTTATLKRRGRKVIMPPAASLVNRYFTVEEYASDISGSRLFNDCFWKSIKFAMAPNGMITFDPTWVGTGSFTPTTGAAVLTSPTLIATPPMAALDATLRLGGVDVADITAFDLTIDNGAVAPAVVASKVSPTVMPGLQQVTMNITLLQKDMTYIVSHANESVLSLSLKAVDNMAEPKNFISINVPNFTLGGADPAPMSTAGGARTVTIPIPAALIGHDPTGTGYDDTAVSVQISNLT
jgi:Phage tail tube protein